MMVERKYIEYSRLKESYNYVKLFLEEMSGTKIKSLQTTIAKDLKLYGDDNYILLEAFVLNNDLNYDTFNYKEYFLDEWEICNPKFLKKNIFIFFLRIPFLIFDIFTFKKFSLSYPKFVKEERFVKDLSFKDMITWYLEKEFKTSNEIKYYI
jgi:hypothetical protein